MHAYMHLLVNLLLLIFGLIDAVAIESSVWCVAISLLSVDCPGTAISLCWRPASALHLLFGLFL
jgi:hypothetical protein